MDSVIHIFWHGPKSTKYLRKYQDPCHDIKRIRSIRARPKQPPPDKCVSLRLACPYPYKVEREVKPRLRRQHGHQPADDHYGNQNQAARLPHDLLPLRWERKRPADQVYRRVHDGHDPDDGGFLARWRRRGVIVGYPRQRTCLQPAKVQEGGEASPPVPYRLLDEIHGRVDVRFLSCFAGGHEQISDGPVHADDRRLRNILRLVGPEI